MSFRMVFETSSDAFMGDLSERAGDAIARQTECASVLRQVARRLDEDETSGDVIDSDGNVIGTWSVSTESA